MTASEIEKSGIYEATKFALTLSDGRVIKFWGDHSDGALPEFFKFNSRENTLQSYYYYDSKGRHDSHITIRGEEILRITILINREQGEKLNANWKMFSYLSLTGLIVMCLYKSCH